MKKTLVRSIVTLVLALAVHLVFGLVGAHFNALHASGDSSSCAPCNEPDCGSENTET